MKPAMIPRPGMMQKQQAMAYHAAAQAQAQAHAHAQAHAAASASSAASQPGSLTHRSGAWQSTLSGAEGGRGSQAAGGMRGPQLVIPRAKVKPRSNYQAGYNSDDDNVSQVSNNIRLICSEFSNNSDWNSLKEFCLEFFMSSDTKFCKNSEQK